MDDPDHEKRQGPRLTQIDFEILLALADAERHGYGIIKEVQQRSQGAVRLGPGTLYGALNRLLTNGLVEESGQRPASEYDDQRRRCYYRLTTTGHRVAAAEASRLATLVRVARSKGLLIDGSPATTGGV